MHLLFDHISHPTKGGNTVCQYLPVKEPHYIFCMFTGRLVRCKLNILAGIYFSCLGRFLHLHAGIFDEIPTVLNVDGNR